MQKVKLGDFVRIRTGKLDANRSSKDGKYPFFTCSVEPLKIDTFSYDCECVLVAGNGDLNVKYYNGKFDAYQRTYIIESLDKKKLSVPYLYEFLNKYIETLRTQSIGGVIKYIKLGNLTDALLTIPSLEEQDSIVEKLKFVSDLIDKRKEQIKKLDLLIKSRFIEMFGEPIKNQFHFKTRPLTNCGCCKNGMNFHIDGKGTIINCLCVGSFKDYFRINDTRVLPTITLNKFPPNEYLLQDEDIVFVRSNGNKTLVGRSVIVYPRNVPTTFSGFCIRFRKTTNDIQAEYLLYLLKSDEVRTKIMGRGANIQNLNQQVLSKIIVPIPPIELQNKFTEFVEKTDKVKQAIKTHLEKLETLKKSLMQQYFG